MFRWLREYREYLKIRRTVKLAMDTKDDQANMAALVRTPGYALLKATMMSAALQEIAKYGAKSEQAPGLARAVGIIAMCESAHDDLAKKARAAKLGITIEELDEREAEDS